MILICRIKLAQMKALGYIGPKLYIGCHGENKKNSFVKNHQWKYICIWFELSFKNSDSNLYKWRPQVLPGTSRWGPKSNIDCK